MLLKICLWLMAVIGSAACYGTQPIITGLEFKTIKYNFGTINEADGPVYYTFQFINKTKQPVVIEDVVTTCGCTIPEYNKQPVFPNERGTIRIKFDPEGLTNTFYKSIQVRTSYLQKIYSLTIYGSIRLSDVPAESLYELLDNVYVDRTLIHFGTKHHGDPTTAETITLYNHSNDNIQLEYCRSNRSNCIEVHMPAQIASGKSGQITLKTIDNHSYYGSIREHLRLIVNGRTSLPISIFGDVVDDMRGIHLDDAPQCEVQDGYFNFGDIAVGVSCEHILTLINRGKSDLFIRKIEHTSNISIASNMPITLKAGARQPIKITVKTNQAGVVDTNLRLITNDPKYPILILKIEGTIH